MALFVHLRALAARLWPAPAAMPPYPLGWDEWQALREEDHQRALVRTCEHLLAEAQRQERLAG